MATVVSRSGTVEYGRVGMDMHIQHHHHRTRRLDDDVFGGVVNDPVRPAAPRDVDDARCDSAGGRRRVCSSRGRRRCDGECHHHTPRPFFWRERWRLCAVVMLSAIFSGGVLEGTSGSPVAASALVVVRPSHHPPRQLSLPCDPSCWCSGTSAGGSFRTRPNRLLLASSSTPCSRSRRRRGRDLSSTPDAVNEEEEVGDDEDRANREYLRDAIVALRGTDEDDEELPKDDLGGGVVGMEMEADGIGDDDDDSENIIGRNEANSTAVTTTSWHFSELCPADDKTCSNWNPPPATKSLVASVLFFVRYLGRFVAERRQQRRRRRESIASAAEILRTSDEVGGEDDAGSVSQVVRADVDGSPEEEADGEEDEPKMSIRETLSKLNTSRKALVQLCGYDADLLKPAFTFLLLGAFFESVRPQFYSSCVTCVVNREPHMGKVVRALVGLTVTSVLGALFTGLRGALFWIAGSRGNYNVRVKLHRNLLRQEAAFFDSTETGVLISRLNNDVNKIGMVVSFHVNVVLRQLAQFLIGSVFLVRMNPRLSVFAFAGIGLVAYISALYGTFARYLSQKVQDMLADAAAVAETSFSMSETVRAFNGIPVESARYEEAQSRSLELEEVQAWTYGLHKLVSDTLQYALQGCLLFACWRVGRAGNVPPARLTSFLFYVHYVLESSNEVGDQWAKIQSAVGGSSSVFDLIRRVPKIRDSDLAADVTLPRLISTDPAVIDAEIIDVDGTSSIDVPGGERPPEAVISMRNMTVTYGTMDVPALDNINMDFYPGDRVAIVGRSGSGKSSMLRTILRFYDPSGGSCSVSGRDLKELTRSEIAKSVSVVQQEPEVFPMTLMENVLYGIERDSIDERTGEPTYSEEYRETVTRALDLAGLPVQFMKNYLGLDLDTRIGEGGRTLSGGQRQRVAIARALVRSPDVLLLDEPTAALDSKSEKVVVKALKNAMEKTRCLVMVTHRLGVVRSLGINKVIVLERGRIAEVGHPEDLLQRGGIYAQLASEQGIFPQKIDGEEQALMPPSRSVGHVAP